MLKKFLLAVAILGCNPIAIAASSKTINHDPNWTGFYLGANAGYWGTQSNQISSSGSVNYINQTYPLGASNIANALAQLGATSASLNPNGFIGGGQAGYNYAFGPGFLVGFHADFEGLTNGNNNLTLSKTVSLVDFSESYTGSLSVTERINYLGTLRARLGYLFSPTFLVYGTGGFAYGNVTENTTWSAQESLGSPAFPAVSVQNNVNKTLPGWTVGAGIEWLFKPEWGTTLEYTYYSFSNLNTSTTLGQTNGAVSPAALWGSANANTRFSLSTWALKVGLNYHFA